MKHHEHQTQDARRLAAFHRNENRKAMIALTVGLLILAGIVLSLLHFTK